MGTLRAILLLSSLSPATASSYASAIDHHADRLDLDPLLVVALVYHESRFYRRARAGRNYGLMQVRVSRTTHAHLIGRERILYRAGVNLRLGMELLAWWRWYHDHRCSGDHPWWAHYQHGKRVSNTGSADRVAATMARLR